jgi:hypothetical protein
MQSDNMEHMIVPNRKKNQPLLESEILHAQSIARSASEAARLLGSFLQYLQKIRQTIWCI